MGCVRSQDTASPHVLQAQLHRPKSVVFTPDPDKRHFRGWFVIFIKNQTFGREMTEETAELPVNSSQQEHPGLREQEWPQLSPFHCVTRKKAAESTNGMGGATCWCHVPILHLSHQAENNTPEPPQSPQARPGAGPTPALV